MKALHKKATGWNALEKETNQKPERHLEIVPHHDCISIYFQDQRQKEIKRINAALVRWESEKPRRDKEREDYLAKMAEASKIERPCSDCGAFCDKKHYGGEENKDPYYPERGDYPFE